MKELYDQKLVRQLAAAVREHSPDDWLASRRMRRARRGKVWRDKLVILFGACMIGLLVNLPLFELSNTRTGLPGAYGLCALLLLAAGMLVSFTLVGCHAVEVTPLIHMPASMRHIYLHALERARRSVWAIFMVSLLVGAPMALVARLAGGGDLPASHSLELAGVGMVVAGSCAFWVVLASLLGRLPWMGMAALTVPLMAFGVFVWMLVRSKFPSIPSPALLGEQLLFLPQARMWEWFAEGGPLPRGPFYYCASMLVFVVLRLSHHLRDQQPEDMREMTLDNTAATAETMLALALRQWRLQPASSKHLQGIAGEEWSEEEPEFLSDSENDESMEEDGVLIQASPDAPQEHSVPVTPEFRERIACSVRRHLDEKWSEDGLPPHLASWEPPLPEWSWILKWAVLAGVLLAVLAELPGHFGTEEWRRSAGAYCMIAAVIVMTGPVMWYQPDAIWLPVLPKLGWLPIDLLPSVRAYERWSGRVLRRRLGFYAMALLAMAVCAGAFILLLPLFGTNYHGIVTARGFITGDLSLPNAAIVLASFVLGERLWATVSFAWQWNLRFERSGMLRVILPAMLLPLAAAGIIAGAIFFCSAVSADWREPGWLKALPCFLAAILGMRFSLRLLPRLHGKHGDWKT